MTNMEIASVINTLVLSIKDLLSLSAAHNINKTIEILLKKIEKLASDIK